MRGIVLLLVSLFVIPFVFSDSPPGLPMVVWGGATQDGSPVPDGLNVTAMINGRNYAQSSVTLGGGYDATISDLDRPLTYNNDSNCNYHWNILNESCVQCIPCSGANCVLGYNESTCVEGPTDGAQVKLRVGNNNAKESFSLQSGSMINQDVNITVIIIFTTSLAKGWNFFSIPVQPDNVSLDNVLKSLGGNFTIVWTTNNGAPQSSRTFFNRLTTIVPNNGYQIYMTSNSVLNISGRKLGLTTIYVAPGWNLMGYPSLGSANITSVLAGKNYSIIWTTNNGAPQSSRTFFNPLKQFNPGNGYQIYAYDKFNFTING